MTRAACRCAASCAAGCALVALFSGASAAQAPRLTSARVGITDTPFTGLRMPVRAPALVRGPVGIAATPVFQTSTTTMPRPDLEPARVAGEMLAGAYAGIAGYFVGSVIGGFVADALPTKSQSTVDQVGFAFGIAGVTLGTAGAVTAVGSIGNQSGSFPTTLAGAAGGVVVGVLLNQLVYGHARLPSDPESSRLRWVEASLEALLPSLGATIAFNSTRKFK